LIRAKDETVALDRIRESLGPLYAQAHAEIEGIEHRIVPVCGDLALPSLGLYSNQFDDLSYEIDTIYHCGAVVNSLLPYSELMNPNVLGTMEILQLATRNKLKSVHFVSSIGYLVGIKDAGEDIDILKLPNLTLHSLNGYTQTKWVSEALIIKARTELSLPCSIFRPGMIAPSSTTGFNNPKDWVNRFLIGSILMKSIPILDPKLHSCDWVPVDYVSQAVIFITMEKFDLCTQRDKFYHLVHPTEKIDFNYLRGLLVEYGWKLEVLEYEKWAKRLVEEVTKENPLFPLKGMFGVGFPMTNRGKWKCVNTLEALGGALPCVFDKMTFFKFLDFLGRIGAVPAAR